MRSRIARALAVLALVAPSGFARPTIETGGILNAASLIAPGLPGGNLAPGSLFLVRGRELGPIEPAVSKTPVDELAGVSVRIEIARRAWIAPILVAGEKEIQALVPDEIALGPASVTVLVRGLPSVPVRTRLVPSNPGLFTLSKNGAGNVRAQSVRRGETITLLATGSGTSKSGIEVFVAGGTAKQVRVERDPECCGLDRITFQVPPDAPTGCRVPIQLRASGLFPGNTATLAIEPSAECVTPGQLSREQNYSGRVGVAVPFRLDMLQDDKTAVVGDALFAGFRSGFLGTDANRLLYPPEPGSCTLYTAAGSLSDVDRYVHTRLLNDTEPLTAGLLSVTLPAGITKTIPHLPLAGDYEYGKLGGRLPRQDGSDPQEELFLNPGTVTISAAGTPVIPSFRTETRFPKSVTWTNRGETGVVNRGEALEVHWTMEDPSQTVAIAGLSLDKPGRVSAAFLCLVPGSAHTFRIPAPILQSLPPTRSRPDSSFGFLLVGTLPSDPVFLHSAAGLDYLVSIGVSISARSVTYR